MIDFIPLENYFEFHINGLLLVVLFIVLNSVFLPIHSPKNVFFGNMMGIITFLFITIFLGFRPVSGRFFGDMGTYFRYFTHYANGGDIELDKDILFHMFMKFCAYFMNAHFFFATCMLLYIYPLLKISYTYFGNLWFYGFLMFVVSFSFFTYGTNGIRNGIATSIFLWGLCYIDKKVIMGLLFALSASFHNTMLLPILAFCITYLYNDPKKYFIGWLVCIPLSLLLGNFWISIFSSLGFADDRLAGYLSGEITEGTFTRTGFRWDFLFHSAFAVFAAYYFIIKKKFTDTFYFRITNVYLLCNGFWILVIKANYSNRFAYLSWFMMAFIIIYPFLKQNFFTKQHIMIGRVITAYFSFTFLMYYLYG